MYLQLFAQCLEIEYVLKSCKQVNHPFSPRIWKYPAVPTTFCPSQDQLKYDFLHKNPLAPCRLPSPHTPRSPKVFHTRPSVLLCKLIYVSCRCPRMEPLKGRIYNLHFLLSSLCIMQWILCSNIGWINKMYPHCTSMYTESIHPFPDIDKIVLLQKN